jgi:hypothetical protein
MSKDLQIHLSIKQQPHPAKKARWRPSLSYADVDRRQLSDCRSNNWSAWLDVYHSYPGNSICPTLRVYENDRFDFWGQKRSLLERRYDLGMGELLDLSNSQIDCRFAVVGTTAK